MIHLFKNVYLTSDSTINHNLQRVVVGNKIAQEMLHEAASNDKTLLFVAHDCQAMPGIFKSLLSLDQKIVVYVSKELFLDVLLLWLSNVLTNASSKSLWILSRALIFRYIVFSNNRSNNIDQIETNLEYKYTITEVEESLDRIKSCKFDTNDFYSSVGVEFLLASYLYDGRFKQELKDSMVTLIRKDLIKYMHEIKEIFLVHLMTTNFTHHLRLSKKFTLEDFENIVDDDSDFAKLFTTDRIWPNTFTTMNLRGDSKIKLTNITNKDIELFKEFTILAGQRWEEESVYTNIKSDISKLDFLDIFRNFTDEMLDRIIEVESTMNHSAGSFFSIDLGTVNHYIIAYLLENRHNKDVLKEYTLGTL